MSSHTSLSDLSNSAGFIINISKQLVFETKHLAGLLRQHYYIVWCWWLTASLLTFGNCVWTTGVIEWPLKLYVHFVTFLRFFEIQKYDLYVFSNTGETKDDSDDDEDLFCHFFGIIG